MPKERDPALSAANVFYMLLVVFIHVSAECVSGYIVGSVPFYPAAAAHRTATVAVQGFIFLAGLKFALSAGRDGFSLPRYYLSRLKRIVLPYLVAFAAFYACYALSGRIEPSVSGAVREFFTGGLTAHFYFVAVIVQFTLLAPLWILVGRRASVSLTLFVSLFLTLIFMDHMPEFISLATSGKYWFTYNSRLFTTYLFYWIAGMTAGRNPEGFGKFLDRRRRAITVLWICGAAVDIALYVAIRLGVYYPIWADDFHLFVSVLAVLTVLSHARKHRDAPLFRTPVFEAADRASYLVYLWHPMVILLLDGVMNRAGASSLTLRFLVRFLPTAPLSVGLCVLWQKFSARIRKEAA